MSALDPRHVRSLDVSRAQVDGRWLNKRVLCWALVLPGGGIRVDPSHGAKTPGFECLFLRGSRDEAPPSWIPLLPLSLLEFESLRQCLRAQKTIGRANRAGSERDQQAL